MRKELKRDIIMAVVMLCVSLVLLIMAAYIKGKFQTEEVGPRFTPHLVAGGLLFLSVLQLIFSLVKCKKEKAFGIKSPEQAKDDEPNGHLWFLLCNKYGHIVAWAVIFFCALAMSQIGFILSAIIIMFVVTYLMCPRNERNIPVFIILSVGVPTATYFVFVKFFFLMLPVGNLWKNLGFF
jgi:hypothetical protein